jgi:hypothetical protein
MNIHAIGWGILALVISLDVARLMGSKELMQSQKKPRIWHLVSQYFNRSSSNT